MPLKKRIRGWSPDQRHSYFGCATLEPACVMLRQAGADFEWNADDADDADDADFRGYVSVSLCICLLKNGFGAGRLTSACSFTDALRLNLPA